MARPRKAGPTTKNAQTYRHPESDLPARPEIGAQAHFKKAKPPTKYRFDSSLAPDLNWDGQNPARAGGFAFFRKLVNRTGGATKISLYNFPQQSAVPFSHALIARLLKALPPVLKGVKDS